MVALGAVVFRAESATAKAAAAFACEAVGEDGAAGAGNGTAAQMEATNAGAAATDTTDKAAVASGEALKLG